ncbi:hypothetical protein J2Y48_005027 [Mycoplana sp. BE70]|uniref:hypothetical protein n=1 Tax=Mycoplana sp. BE70 TaxID=2817775 RepID=UPI0028635771|nr:hypothetical protein [Mycoplana sp. BE70]MDR6759709.1 hypothetical protein [Mycoplana sp. BE70]
MGAFPPEGKQLIPERQLVLNTMTAYTDAISIVDERWNASAARECCNRNLTLTTDVLALEE